MPVADARWLRLCCLVLVAVLVAACGGNDSNHPPTETSVSGVVQKGLFSDLDVTVYVVDETTGVPGEPLTTVISGQSFSVAVPPDTLLLLEAVGEFDSELTGATIVLDQPLRALVIATGDDLTVNINYATHLAAERTLAQLTAGGQDAAALISANNALVNDVFGFPASTDATQLSFDNISSTSDMDDPDLLLLLYSAALVGSLTGDLLFADGFGVLVDDFVAAVTPADVQDALGQMKGYGAQALYDTIDSGGFAGALPSLSLATDHVFNCTRSGVCDWFPQSAPTLAISSRVVFEASGNARVYARLSAPLASPLEFTLATRSSSATQGFDFGAVERTFTIAPGGTSVYLSIPLMIDALEEPDELLFVDLVVNSADVATLATTSRVIIRDGGTQALLAQDLGDMELVGVCVSSIGVLDEPSRQPCSPLIDPMQEVIAGKGYAMSVQIDLAATCSVSTDCMEQSADWPVDFQLVAENSRGQEQTRTELGPYRYDHASVQLSSAFPSPRNLLISLASPIITAFLNDALLNGWVLRLEVRLDATPELVASVDLPVLVPLADEILVGDRAVPLDDVSALVPGDGGTCPVGTYALTGDLQVGTTLNTLSGLATGTVCVNVIVDAAGMVSNGLLVVR